MTLKRWKFKDPVDKTKSLALADSLNISTILADLLINRNVTSFLQAKHYFRPLLDELHNPFLMDGMEKATSRVIKALTTNQKITIYGDYDVDGTCASSLMYLFLKRLGGNVDVHIPKRLTEGYGLSVEGIDQIYSQKTDLIISVDCGITAISEVDYANTLGIDIIICDHHQPKEEIPRAYAVLDPLKPGDNYPFKYLSGAGVAFKLARAVADKFGKKEIVLDYVDLVALASTADIVPLIDENRILVRKGLEMINTNPRPGIKALLQAAKLDFGNLSSNQIVFSIAPRINAVGRLGDAQIAVDLFTCETVEEANKLAKFLEEKNIERRKIDEITYSFALEKAEEFVDFETDKGIVLHSDDWHPGVIGIVASRLVEKYYRPSVMLTTIDGVAKGSARSIKGFNIYSALEECNDLLIQFGGHEAAAGLEISLDKIDEFRIKFNSILDKRMTENDIIPEIEIDSELHFSEITNKFLRILEQFAPFGPKNSRPVFFAKDVKFNGKPRIVGTNHVIGVLSQKASDKVFDSIGFNMGYIFQEVDDFDNVLMDIVFTIDQYVKWDKVFPQIKIKDIKIKS